MSPNILGKNMSTYNLIPNMMKLRLDRMTTEIHDLSPSTAKQILQNWEYHKQRNIRPSRVTTYQRQMYSGDWTYRTEMHVGVLPDGRCYLLNGYHRLRACANLGDTSHFKMPVLFIYRFMKDEQDLADYYGVIDIGGTRSSGDAIKAQGLAEQWGVAVEVLKSAGTAGAMIMTDFSGGRSNSWHSAVGRSMPARIRFLREWEEEIRAAHELIKPALSQIKKLVLRQPVMAIMLLTLKHVPDRAPDFWGGVISGEGLYRGMPELTLRNYLLQNPMSGTHEHLYARYVANCWNGFMRRDKMIRVQVKSQGTQDLIVVEGTPYSRGRRERERLQRLEAQRATMRENRKKSSTPDYPQDEEILPEE